MSRCMSMACSPYNQHINIRVNGLYSYKTCLGHMLGFTLFLTHIYYTLYFPHVLLVSTSCSSRGFFMFSLLLPYYFFKDILLIFYSLQVYIVVNTVLYLDALPFDYSSHSFSSLCLSCNLSQAQDHNKYNIKVEDFIYFHFYFSFLFLFLDLGLGVIVTSHMTITVTRLCDT